MIINKKCSANDVLIIDAPKGFYLRDDGLYAEILKKKTTEIIKLGNRLTVIDTEVIAGVHNLIIEFIDSDGNMRSLSFPRGLLVGAGATLKLLMNNGYIIEDLKYKNKIADYLIRYKPSKQQRISNID